MTTNKKDADGRVYREVEHEGSTYILDPASSKLSLLNTYGIVNAGGDFSFTAPAGTPLAGQTFSGYTDQEPFVGEFRDMLAEMKADYKRSVERS